MKEVRGEKRGEERGALFGQREWHCPGIIRKIPSL